MLVGETEMAEKYGRSKRFNLLMPEDIQEAIERAAAEKAADMEAAGKKWSVTQEINSRLRISLGAQSTRFQTILAREAFGSAEAAAPGIAPSAPITPPSTGPQGQAVHLSDIDMEMLRIFHTLPIHKQLALVSLFK